MVGDGHDESQSVALVEQTFDLVPVAEETHHLLQRLKSHIGEEVLALLKDSDCKGLLNLGRVLGQVGHNFASRSERLAALLRNLEGRLLKLDKFVQSGNMGVAFNLVDVLNED